MKKRTLQGEELGKRAYELWASKGLPVFPCKADKSPYTRNGFKDATTDKEQILTMFAHYNAEMIGGRMGEPSGLFAVDLDLYKPEGKATKERIKHELHDTRVHLTARGGEHYIYTTPENTEIASCAPWPGCEIKGNGGYIILPPSTGYEVKNNRSTAEATQPLLALIRSAIRDTTGATDDQLASRIITGENLHDALTQLAARRQGRGGSLSATTAHLIELLEASVAKSPKHARHERWLKIMQDDGKELSRIISSAYNKFSPKAASERLATATQETRQHDNRRKADKTTSLFTGKQIDHTTSEPDGSEGHSAPSEEDDESTQLFDRSYHVSSVYTLDSDRSFIVYPLLFTQDIAIISADAKAGKTLFMMTTCLHMAAGIPFGDLEPIDDEGHASRVPFVYFAMESQGAIRDRIKAWHTYIQQDYEVNLEDMPALVVEKNFDLTDALQRNEVVNKLIQHNFVLQDEGYEEGLGLVVIDTLTKAMPGKNQNTTDDTSLLFKFADEMKASGLRCAIIFLHHTKKDGTGPRGSTNILAEPDLSMMIEKETGLVSGERRQIAKLNIYNDRAVDETFTQFYAMLSVTLGTNKQGKEVTAAVLEHLKEETTIDKRTDEELEMADNLKQCRLDFYDWLVSTLILDQPTTIKELVALLDTAPATVQRHYTKYNKRGRKSQATAWRFLTKDCPVTGWGMELDTASMTVTAKLTDSTLRRANYP